MNRHDAAGPAPNGDQPRTPANTHDPTSAHQQQRRRRTDPGTAQPVRLAADVYAALQALAIPFQDDVNSVLRRVLGLAPAPPADEHAPLRPGRAGLPPRAARGSIRSLTDYELPILRALIALGGRAATAEVMSRLDKDLDPPLTPTERQRPAYGRTRWQQSVHQARLTLILRGHLASDSPRGLWEISTAGRELLNDGHG